MPPNTGSEHTTATSRLPLSAETTYRCLRDAERAVIIPSPPSRSRPDRVTGRRDLVYPPPIVSQLSQRHTRSSSNTCQPGVIPRDRIRGVFPAPLPRPVFDPLPAASTRHSTHNGIDHPEAGPSSAAARRWSGRVAGRGEEVPLPSRVSNEAAVRDGQGGPDGGYAAFDCPSSSSSRQHAVRSLTMSACGLTREQSPTSSRLSPPL